MLCYVYTDDSDYDDQASRSRNAVSVLVQRLITKLSQPSKHCKLYITTHIVNIHPLSDTVIVYAGIGLLTSDSTEQLDGCTACCTVYVLCSFCCAYTQQLPRAYTCAAHARQTLLCAHACVVNTCSLQCAAFTHTLLVAFSKSCAHQHSTAQLVRQ
jgi:hypothetical protein